MAHSSDLHDFADVAENYDFYVDRIIQHQDHFEEFYLDLARQHGGDGVLDIACGTGALLLPLARAGFPVTGLDVSAEMVRVARHKLDTLLPGNRVETLTADMTDFSLRRKASLAIIARSGFLHLLTPEDQRRALHTIRRHLTSDGVLTLNTFEPNVELQHTQLHTGPEDYTLRLEYVNAEGNRERIYNAITYDPATQLMGGNWKYETLDKAGRVAEVRIRPFHMRQTYRLEMLYLFELCGYRVLQVYGGYDKEPPDYGGTLIWVVGQA